MDLLKTKYSIKSEIYDLYNMLQFKKNKINIIGSASYKNYLYFSDYDLMTIILKHFSSFLIHKEFERIISNVNTNYVFLEFKIQRLDGTKKKYYNLESFTIDSFEKEFHDVEYCKIDLAIYKNYRFIEVSCNYIFKEQNDNIEKSLLKDFDELIKEKQYYKALKRMFSILVEKHNTNKQLVIPILTILYQFFNSEYGHMYQTVSNLNTIKLILSKYSDPEIIKKVIYNLEVLKIKDIHSIDDYIKKISKVYNKKAKEIYIKYFKK